MAMNTRWMAWIAAIALLGLLSDSTALAGPLGLIDDFNDTVLTEYTSTVILDANGGASNTATWQSPSGTLELVTSTYDGIEQYAFIRSGISLLVGEEVQMDLVHTPDSQDLGLYVGGTTPVTGTRQDYVAMYARNDGAVYSRGFDGTTEYPLVGGDTPTYDKLFIARVDDNTYEAGWYESGVRNVLVSRTPTTANDGDVVGFYADVRDVGTLGSADNLTIAPGFIAGDVTGDHVIDLNDFDVIKDNFYLAVTMRSEGDLNGDGIVDFADFREWKDNYPGAGAGALAGTLVPEPASWILLCMCGALMLAVRRSRKALVCTAAVLALACTPAVMAGPLGLIDDFSSGSLSSYTFSRVNDGNTESNVSFAIGAGEDLRVSYAGSSSHEQVLFLRDDYTLDVGQSLVADVVNPTAGWDRDLGIAVGFTATPTALGSGQSGDVRTTYVETSRRSNDQVMSYARDGASNLTSGQEFNGNDYGGQSFNTTDPLSLYITRASATLFQVGWVQNGTQHLLWSNTVDFQNSEAAGYAPYDFTTDVPGAAVGFYADVRAPITESPVGLNNLRIEILQQVDGDVDSDGDVDLDDYAAIEGHLFDAATMRSEGDLNGDGIVDFFDFRQWKANYVPPGSGALAGVNIPEPASVLLCTIGLAMVAVGFRRRSRAIPLLVLLVWAAACCAPATAQEFNTTWTNTGAGDFTNAANWDQGVPDINTVDFGIITNGGTATLSSTPSFTVGGLRLGVAGGETGTLSIDSGGNMTVDENLAFFSDGSVTAGVSGTGLLTIAPGGTLTSLSLASGGEASSTITLGGTAVGTTTVNTGDATFGRTTHVTGPNVSFLATGSLTFADTSILQAEITGSSHSALGTAGTATLDGALEVSFNSYSPVGTDTWNLVDAATISGNFSSVTATSGLTLPADKALAVRTQAGGSNGNVAQLYIAQLLVLNVDRDTGDVSISNPGTTGIELDGYGIRSAAGSLDATGWTSLESQTVAGWAEANPSPNHISELKAVGPSTLGAGLSWSLGNIYSQAAPTEFGVSTEDLAFLYTVDGNESIDSVVQYTGTESINNLVLYVDPTSGEVNLRNTSPFTVDIDGYTVGSDSGALQSGDADWNSLEDQGVAGGNWYESNVSATRVSELQASGVTTLSPNTTYNLGTLYDTASAEDLIFEFVLGGEADPMMGAVLYQAAPSVALIGDYNEDGMVDAADYTVWRDNVGGSTLANRDPANSGQIGEDDYASWKAHFGESTGSGSSLAVTAVPEPASWILLCISGVLLLAVQRTARTVS